MRSTKSIARGSSLLAPLLLTGVMLAGCAGKHVPVIKDTVHEALVPVAAPCVNGTRPAGVRPLREQFSAEEWKALQPQQKAALVGLQGLGLLKQVEDLDAATAGCP